MESVAELNLFHSVFIHNRAQRGGGNIFIDFIGFIYLFTHAQLTFLITIKSVTVQFNICLFWVCCLFLGAVALRSFGKITIRMCDFFDSASEGDGGAALFEGQVDIENSTFFANVAHGNFLFTYISYLIMFEEFDLMFLSLYLSFSLYVWCVWLRRWWRVAYH